MEKTKAVGENVGFERIRRITGYLVGTLDHFNDAKYAEVQCSPRAAPIIAPAARTPAPMILREDMMGIPTGCLRNSAKTLCWPA